VPLLRLDALDTEWSGLAPLLSGLRRAGRVVQLFDHFGNWHDTVPHGSWTDYLAARPGRLRETIRRKTARAERDPALRLTMARTPSEVGAALPAYLDVYRRSWKEPEPYPRFDASLLPAAAAAGVLRLGVFWHADTPIAAQYWIVEHGAATVLKLAHDEQHKALSPGTVLTAWIIRHLIEADAVRTLDFGRGDDPYKADWVSRRRQRIGVIAADPFSPRGLAAIARHAAGRVLRRVR
jgi:CelD/BcsL family acetyltransferase involved in cellulose biosynthesis